MPRRSSARNSTAVQPEPQAPQEQVALDPVSENFRKLRQHWKWAAFCQFFYIFFDLVAINDISLEDIENDLAHGTDVFLPRIMQRLLFTLSYDRKISLDNWQNALRRQYDRRNPDANPLGSLSTAHTANNSRFSSVLKEEEGAETKEDAENEKEGREANAEEAPADGDAEGATAAPKEEEPAPKKKKETTASVTEEKPTIDWSELSMDQKLESLHTLVEWQFQNPARLRGLMKSDDETATWRSEPIGYDREQNSYWLIGGNRLWIQRSPPKPPNRKRKRKAPSGPEPKGRNTSKAGSSKRQRLTKTQSSTKAKAKEAPPTPTAGRSSRAAKEQAKAKLDAQAKALAEFNRQAAASTTPPATSSGRTTRSRGAQPAAKLPPAPAASRSAGTRISARLRGIQDDGWQAVPDEWLNEEAGPSKAPKTGLESDDESISDLTELSDEEEENAEEKAAEESKDAHEEDEAENVEEGANKGPFIEWETLCITMAEWQAFPERFAKSTYYTEKAFYKLLTTIVVPEVVAELKAVEEKRRLEEALNHRKRSSRLATREHEKEAAKLAAQKKAEEDERNSRARRLEARQQREEEERLKKEKAREERRLKRESRAAEQALEGKEDDEEEEEEEQEDEEYAPSPQDDNEEYQPTARAAKRAARQPARPRQPAKSTKSTKKATKDEWEVNCEVCLVTGKNLDDGKPMMSCGLCGKWQHISCHDQREARLGRPKRDWTKIEFFCSPCAAMKANGAHRYSNGTSHSAPNMQQQAMQQYSRASSSWQTSYGKAYGVPEPSPYAQSYLPQTSSVRSPYPVPQTNYANPNPYMAPNNFSFSHYQPQERAFTAEGDRMQQQSSYYRVNGHSSTSSSTGWGSSDRTRYHQPQQNYATSTVPAWNASHYNQHPLPTQYGTPNRHTPLTTPATFQQQQAPSSLIPSRGLNGVPLEGHGGSSGSTMQRASYDALARESAYRQQQQTHQQPQQPQIPQIPRAGVEPPLPPAVGNTVQSLSYHRTPTYPPHS